ncbi:hypothetical protein ACU686_23320 [Yinghuangia aomiensis]
MHATHAPPFASPPEAPRPPSTSSSPTHSAIPALGFRDGTWFRIGHAHPPRPCRRPERDPRAPRRGGTIVQIMCWWMREHPGDRHAVDLATRTRAARRRHEPQHPTPRMPPGPRECLPAVQDG